MAASAGQVAADIIFNSAPAKKAVDLLVQSIVEMEATMSGASAESAKLEAQTVGLGTEAIKAAKSTQLYAKSLADYTASATTAGAATDALGAKAQKSAAMAADAAAKMTGAAAAQDRFSKATVGYSAAQSNANLFLTQFSFMVQDMPWFLQNARMGMMAVSNNLGFLAAQFGLLQQQTRGTGGVMMLLKNALSGPGGMVLGVSTAIAAVQALGMILTSTGKQAKEANDKLQDYLETLIKLSEVQFTTMKSNAEEMFDALEKRRKELIGLIPVSEGELEVYKAQGLAQWEINNIVSERAARLQKEVDIVGEMLERYRKVAEEAKKDRDAKNYLLQVSGDTRTELEKMADTIKENRRQIEHENLSAKARQKLIDETAKLEQKRKDILMSTEERTKKEADAAEKRQKAIEKEIEHTRKQNEQDEAERQKYWDRRISEEAKFRELQAKLRVEGAGDEFSEALAKEALYHEQMVNDIMERATALSGMLQGYEQMLVILQAIAMLKQANAAGDSRQQRIVAEEAQRLAILRSEAIRDEEDRINARYAAEIQFIKDTYQNKAMLDAALFAKQREQEDALLQLRVSNLAVLEQAIGTLGATMQAVFKTATGDAIGRITQMIALILRAIALMNQLNLARSTEETVAGGLNILTTFLGLVGLKKGGEVPEPEEEERKRVMVVIPRKREKVEPVSLPGFAGGGFTGQRGEDRIAGVVHGGEIVFEKALVDQNRSMLLGLRSALQEQGKGTGTGSMMIGDLTPVLLELRALRSEVKGLEIQTPVVLEGTLDGQTFLKRHAPRYERYVSKKRFDK